VEPPKSILDRLQALGIQGKFENEDKALEYLASQAKQAEAQRGYANLGMQFSELQRTPQWQAYLEHLQAQQRPQQPTPAAAPPQQPAAPQGFQYKAPDFNQAWLDLITQDEHGNLVGIPGTEQGLAQKVLDWQRFVRDKSTEFFRDPGAFMRPFVDQYGLIPSPEQRRAELQAIVGEMLQAHFGQQQTQTAAEKALAEVDAWAWERGLDGQPVVDATGRKTLSADGYRYHQELEKLAYLPSLEDRHRYAVLAVGRGPSPSPAAAGSVPTPAAPAAPAAPPAPPPSPAQINAALKDEFTNRIPPGGGYNPSRSGSFTPAGSLSKAAQADDVVDDGNFFQKMMTDLAAQGAA
jgi:hypothetical protein